MALFSFGDTVVSTDEILAAEMHLSYGWGEGAYAVPNGGHADILVRGKADGIGATVPGEDAGLAAIASARETLAAAGLTEVPENAACMVHEFAKRLAVEKAFGGRDREDVAYGYRECVLYVRAGDVSAVERAEPTAKFLDSAENRRVSFRGEPGWIMWHGEDASLLASLVR